MPALIDIGTSTLTCVLLRIKRPNSIGFGMSLRPSDAGIGLIAGGALFAVVMAAALEGSLPFFIGGAIMVVFLVRMMVRS